MKDEMKRETNGKEKTQKDITQNDIKQKEVVHKTETHKKEINKGEIRKEEIHNEETSKPQNATISRGFELFLKDTSGVGTAFFAAIETLSKESALEEKVHELAYIAVLTALGKKSGMPFHIERAKHFGATKEEVRSAILVPLPLIGIQVMDALEVLEEIYE